MKMLSEKRKRSRERNVNMGNKNIIVKIVMEVHYVKHHFVKQEKIKDTMAIV